MQKLWRNSGVNYYKMAQSNLKIQQFRANDIVDNGGKQFELGKSWCLDFFQIPVEDINPIINLVFKPLSEKHAHLSDYRIELKLAEVTKREDRKAYSNSETGRSQIKDFFIDKLHLKWPDNSEDYFAIMDTNSTEYNLYYIPQLMYENFISFFKSQDINVTTVAGNHLNITDKNKILQQIFMVHQEQVSHTQLTESQEIKRLFVRHFILIVIILHL